MLGRWVGQVRWSLVLGSALLALGATSCAAGSAAPPGATVPTAVIGAPPPNPYAVPAVITKAYVQRVLNALEAVNAQATQLIVAHRSLVPAARTDLSAIDTAPEVAIQTKLWRNDLNAGLPNLLPKPGLIKDTVTGLLAASSSCVFVSATSDTSTVERVPSTQPVYFALVSRPQGGSGSNPTPWLISFLGGTANGTAPPNQCP
ncbi:MAG: hypothetical protein ACRDY2_07170 [Acidimicrobiales bacterium]